MELIYKNKLLEELKKLKQNLSASPIVVIEDVESLVESLEVKEVDLVKEYDNNFSNDPVYSKLVNRNAGIGIAKHFFNLGLKAKGAEGICKISETECPNFDEAQGTSFVK